MTIPVDGDSIGHKGAGPARLGIYDPLLQELWAIKASLNAAAEYSVERLAEKAKTFNPDAKLASLQRQIKDGHHR